MHVRPRPTPHQVSRPRTGPRPTRSSYSATRPVQPVRSELDEALEAALAAPAPDVGDFAELGLPAPLVDVLARSGITTPFPIQARTVPDALAGRDVLGRGQTGSGKTLAFGLPMLARLARAESGERRPRTPRGLVLVPTRELAGQVHDALAPLGRALGLRLATVYGGAAMRPQVEALRRGVDVVIATPGRLLDLIRQGECSLERVEVTVVDEADYMADLGFLPDVTTILDDTPAGGQRLLFSATLDNGVDALVRRYLTDPATHAVAPASATVTTMEHRAYTVHRADKVAVAAEIARRPARTLFFVRTKLGADRLVEQLREAGVDAAAIHGDLTQHARRRALDAFGRGRTRVLVATDVAARGIHVDDLDLVVHFDPPTDAKDYVHRSGRTARAGAGGTVLSLLYPDQARTAERQREDAGVHAQTLRVRPGDEAVRELTTSGEPVVVQPEPAREGRGPRGPRGGGYRGRSEGRPFPPRGDRRRSPRAA